MKKVLTNIKYSLITTILLCIYHFNDIYIKICQYFNKKNYILFIKNSEIIKKQFFHITDDIVIMDYDSIKTDYYILNYNINNKNLVKVAQDYNDTFPTCCNFKFILVAIKSNNKIIDITKYLCNKNTSYYLENSILFDTNFKNWFDINYLNENLDNIKIYIIDHNANEFELDDSQYITLGLNNYSIGN
jgi:hypothetical protein